MQGRPQILRRLGGVGGMPSNRRKYIGELLGQLDRAHAAGEIGADADDFGNAGRLGPRDYFRQLHRKIGISEMGVGVIEYRHNNASTLPAGPAAFKALKSETRNPK